MTARASILACLAALGLAGTALADVVMLTNGRKFEGVVAETAGDQVTIRVGGGALVLPLSQIAAIERGASPIAEFDRMTAELEKNPKATAADWLDLARYAVAHELDYGVRKAGLAAAALEPQLDGLAPILVRLGYEYVAARNQWLPYDEAMRARGFRRWGDEWLTGEEYAARVRDATERMESSRRAAEAARSERIAALAESALAVSVARSSQPAMVMAPVWSYAVPVPFVLDPWMNRPRPMPQPMPQPQAPQAQDRPPGANTHGGMDIVTRQPGSLIPISSSGSPPRR
jgi:hypothetical protein